MRRMPLVFPKLYAIMDAALLKTTELACAEMLAQAGVELIQYRNKSATSRQLFEVSHSLAKFLHGRGARFLVNDRTDLAALADAGGVHVGQQDLGVEEAREICGKGRWVGVSTHTLEQVRRAAQSSADYIAVGPVFATRTKSNPGTVVGTQFVREARRLTRKPIVAIGGIAAGRAREVVYTGAAAPSRVRPFGLRSPPGGPAREGLDMVVAGGG